MATTESDVLGSGLIPILRRNSYDPSYLERYRDLYGHDPDATEEEIAKFVCDSYHEQDSAMWSRFHEWSYNIQFAAGRQWLTSTDGRTWFEPPPPTGTVRVTNNLTWRAGEYRVSKLTESRPTPKVIPHSNEVDDADKAEAAQQLLGHLDRELDMGAKWDEALWYDWLCGCAFIYVGYSTETGQFIAAKKMRPVIDPMTGMVAYDPMTGEPQLEEYFVDADGNEVGDPAAAFTYRTGDVDVKILPPWAVRVSDPQETDFRKQRRVWVGTIEDVADIKAAFGARADDISGGDEYDQFAYHESIINGWSHDGHMRRPFDRPYVPRSLVIRMYERPCEAFPRGRYAVVCENKLLAYEEELPFGSDEVGYDIPIVQLRTTTKPKDFYGMPGINLLIPIQKRINQLESHAVEYIRLFSRGGIVAEYGTMFEESWNDNYGSVIYYQGKAPSPLSWPGMPADVWQALNRAYEAFDRISGWGDVARGSVPPGVKAAKAILELKRSNDTPLGKALERFDRAQEKTYAMVLERARWGYTEPHVIQVLGADSPHLVRALTADNLPMRFAVKIETDSMLRLSYAAKLELLFELADRQWIDKDAAKRMLNFADWEYHSGQWNRDYSRARMKMDQLMAGQPVTVEWWEDDAVHMLAIGERLKDPRFEQLDPMVKQMLTQLWLAHYQQWMMKQAGMLPPHLMMGQAGPPPEQAMGQGRKPERQPPDFAGGEARFDPQDVTAAEAVAGFDRP